LVTDRVHGKQLYMPMNSSATAVNRLTGSQSDPATHTPAYKEVAVSLQVFPGVDESPLPRGNFRFGHPTPQRGVKVERKWKRPDYSPPGAPLVQIRIQRKQG
jgi:formate dehydrogenase major subunit